MTWRSAARRLGVVASSVPEDVGRLTTQLAAGLRGRLLLDPPRWALGALRRACPTVRLGQVTLYTRGADVVRVLGDAERHPVTPYGRIMRDLVGSFALGVDGSEHTTLRTDIDDVLERIDLAAARDWADAAALDLLTTHLDAGIPDAEELMASDLPARFFLHHGLLPASGSPEGVRDDAWISLVDRTEELVGLAPTVYQACFGNPGRDRGVHAKGRTAAASLTDQGCDTMQLGLLVGAISPTAEAITRAAAYLRARPELWTRVQRAALETDHETIRAYVLEALRFSPQAPTLVRGRSGAGPEEVAMVSTLSAMHDPQRVPEPRRFVAGRPDDTYLHFGSGPHRCAGRAIAELLLTSGVRALALAAPPE